MAEIFYIFILLFAFILSHCAQKTEKKSYVLFLVILLTIASGYRGITVGIDTPSYYVNIEEHFNYSWKFREEGFRLISNIIYDTTGKSQLVFVFCALITNLLILSRLWDFRKEGSYCFMVLLYLLMYYSNSMIIMRQYLALSLVFFGTRYLKDKKIVLFLLFLIGAFFIHRSSLLAIGYVAITLWNAMSKKQKTIFALPLLFVVAGSVMYVAAYLASDIVAYSEQSVSNVNITFFYHIFIFLFVIIMKRKEIRITFGKLFGTSKSKEAYHIDWRIELYYAIGLSLSALSMFFAFMGRAGLYYIIFELVFWGIAYKKMKNRGLYAVLVLILAFYEITLVIFFNSGGLFPYYLYLQ